MNNKNLMNQAANNIRMLAVSMVEKAKSGHPGGAWVVPTLLMFFSLSSWSMILTSHLGKDETDSSLTLDTCRPCFILRLPCKASSALTT